MCLLLSPLGDGVEARVASSLVLDVACEGGWFGSRREVVDNYMGFILASPVFGSGAGDGLLFSHALGQSHIS